MLLTGTYLAAIITVNALTNRRLTNAADTLVQEQAGADRINQAVMRQLVAVSALWSDPGSDSRRELDAAENEVYGQIRQYLLQDLTTEERLLVEAMKEEQQRLEVASAETSGLLADGDDAHAAIANLALTRRASALQSQLETFLGMRRMNLEHLRATQQASFKTLYLSGIALGFLVLLGILALVRFLHRRVNDPLGQISIAAVRIGNGDLDVFVPEDNDQEFARLARSFNQMTAGLRGAKADVQTRNDELAAALDQLALAQDGLLQTEKLRAMGEMTAGVAHELNNPLTAVLGYAELMDNRLKQDGRSVNADELRRDFLQPVLDEARRVHDLVRSLLRFSRKSGTDLQPVALREAIDVAVNLRAFAFQQAGLELEIGDTPDCHILAETQRLQEVFLNIINNALDAMRPAGAGALSICAALSGRFVVVTMEDDGPGLACPERVLEPFYSTKAPGEGTGLGLALVHRFMEEFDGSVHAENRTNGGARFVLRFQVAQPTALGTLSARQRAESGYTPGAALASRRILIVEDEPHLRDLQRRILHRIHAETLLASNVTEARALLEEHHIELIISDVKMPGGSGLELYRWVEENLPELLGRFLFVTGDTSDPDVLDLSEQEPDMFVRKPFEIAEYLDRVTGLLD